MKIFAILNIYIQLNSRSLFNVSAGSFYHTVTRYAFGVQVCTWLHFFYISLHRNQCISYALPLSRQFLATSVSTVFGMVTLIIFFFRFTSAKKKLSACSFVRLLVFFENFICFFFSPSLNVIFVFIHLINQLISFCCIYCRKKLKIEWTCVNVINGKIQQKRR